MTSQKITRQQLYDSIWSEPRSSISRKYNISDHELLKLCKKLSVPIPPAGYFQRLRHGKNIPGRLRLSDDYAGELEVTLPSKTTGDKSNDQESPLDLLMREIESDPRLNISVPKKLVDPDPLIVKAKNSMANRLKDRYYRDGIVGTESHEIRIGVSKAHIDRALRIMDVLIKSLKVRGHSFHLDYDTSSVVILGQHIEISLIEKSKRFEVNRSQWDRYELRLTGKLSFRIRRNFETKEWIDGKVLLEEKISKILAVLEMEGERLKLRQEELEKRWKIQEQEEEVRRQKALLKEKEFSAFKRLVTDANRWHQTTILRQYIDAVETKGSTKDLRTNDLGPWLEWARKKADWLDPTIEQSDELLADVDRSKVL